MAKIDLFVDLMFHSADQTHLWHLQTKSYALHKALNGYYDGIRDGLDAVAEAYMGYKGKRLAAQGKLPLVPFKDTAQVAAHLESVCTFLTDLNEEIGKEKGTSHIVNIIDTLKELVDKTKYLLTLG